MPETVPSLIDKLAESAAILGDPEVTELVEAVREHGERAKLQILLVGSAGSGRSSTANILLESRGLLPPSRIPKQPLSILVRHGASLAVEAISRDGTRAALPPGRLRSLLTDPIAGRQYAAVEVQAPYDLLKTCDLRIEMFQTHRSAEQWRSLLAGTDFTICLLNATALLSQAERDFIREHLAAEYGLQRVAIAVNQMDLIPIEERGSLLDLVRTFLGPFEGQPAVLALSAAGSLEGNEREALITLVSELAERHSALRAAALRHGMEAALAALTEGVRRRHAQVSLDRTETEELRRSIAERREALQRRVERARRKVDAFIGTLIREQLQREIEEFGEVFRRRLPDEVMSIEDLTVIKRHLPGYIETVWREFLNDRMIAVRSRLLDEALQLERLIEDDLGDLLGSVAADVRRTVYDFKASEDVMRTFVMPRRGTHHASGVAKGLSLHGYVMLVFNPALGILSLAASHGVRHIYREGIARSDKEAIVAAAVAATRELERELRAQIEEHFAHIGEQVQTEVAARYAEGIARVEEAIEESLASGREIDARREQIGVLATRTIPELRLLLGQLEWREVA